MFIRIFFNKTKLHYNKYIMTNECNVLQKVESWRKNKWNTLKLNNNNVKPQTIDTNFSKTENVQELTN